MEIYREIMENLSSGRPFVLATLIRALGSVPRDAGAKMLVFSDGSITGTIGGGEFERLVIQDSLAMMSDGEPSSQIKHYKLEETGKDATGMFCGGDAQVFFELNRPSATLYIFGGGHIGRALAKVVDGLDFRVVVVDDRPDILSHYREPVKTILTDSNFDANFPQIEPDSYAVIVTHGHGCDGKVLKKIVDKNCAYIGMIGSKRKIAKTYELLIKDGVDKSKLDKVRSPIGLDIGAEGPQEIAISIAAEIIAVKHMLTPRR